eukprot:TRINITY_DN3208_c0_g1_i1.p1 TRINITY_DN3208_c0_g1~~TRINITY_DN3208_c0_g1_i1.p1  ORF type:complete len:124 (+),score=54.05 TRINITY_DN3208_c0_g1_i1:53-373(+)
MKVFVSTLAGSSTELQVCATDSIADVKSKFHEAKGVPTDMQVLSFKGDELSDGTLVKSCGVAEGTTLQCSMKLKGGNAGDIIAILLAIVIIFIAIFAGLGWYARRR